MVAKAGAFTASSEGHPIKDTARAYSSLNDELKFKGALSKNIR
jgi:hypothetical protein